MITETDIQTALTQHLASVPGIPAISWENREATLTPSYVLCEIVRVSRPNTGLRGDLQVSRGFLMASVLSQPDTFATPALQLADTILAHFPATSILTAPTGRVVIGSGQVMQGYNDGLYFRVPVQINYQAH